MSACCVCVCVCVCVCLFVCLKSFSLKFGSCHLVSDTARKSSLLFFQRSVDSQWRDFTSSRFMEEATSFYCVYLSGVVESGSFESGGKGMCGEGLGPGDENRCKGQ